MHMCWVHTRIGRQVLVQERRIGLDSFQDIEHRWQWFVGDSNTLCRRFGSRQICRCYGCQYSPTVQDLRPCKQSLVLEVTAKAVFWCIPGRQDCLDAREALSLTRIHGKHARMRIRTEMQLPMEE